MGQRGVTITKIFYASYTSYEQCKEILADLRRLGMATMKRLNRIESLQKANITCKYIQY